MLDSYCLSASLAVQQQSQLCCWSQERPLRSPSAAMSIWKEGEGPMEPVEIDEQHPGQYLMIVCSNDKFIFSRSNIDATWRLCVVHHCVVLFTGDSTGDSICEQPKTIQRIFLYLFPLYWVETVLKSTTTTTGSVVVFHKFFIYYGRNKTHWPSNGPGQFNCSKKEQLTYSDHMYIQKVDVSILHWVKF